MDGQLMIATGKVRMVGDWDQGQLLHAIGFAYRLIDEYGAVDFL